MLNSESEIRKQRLRSYLKELRKIRVEWHSIRTLNPKAKTIPEKP